MPTAITVDASAVIRSLGLLGNEVQHWERPLYLWARWIALDIQKSWSTHTMSSDFRKPTSFRGVAIWPGVKDQYTRKTDGAVVPPWGGTPRIRRGWHSKFTHAVLGKETLAGRHSLVWGGVQGKKKRSGFGARTKPGDVVGQDSGRMVDEFTGGRGAMNAGELSSDSKSISLVGRVRYASRFNKRRHIDQVGERDAKQLYDLTSEHITASLHHARLA